MKNKQKVIKKRGRVFVVAPQTRTVYLRAVTPSKLLSKRKGDRAGPHRENFKDATRLQCCNHNCSASSTRGLYKMLDEHTNTHKRKREQLTR